MSTKLQSSARLTGNSVTFISKFSLSVPCLLPMPSPSVSSTMSRLVWKASGIDWGGDPGHKLFLPREVRKEKNTKHLMWNKNWSKTDSIWVLHAGITSHIQINNTTFASIHFEYLGYDVLALIKLYSKQNNKTNDRTGQPCDLLAHTTLITSNVLFNFKNQRLFVLYLHFHAIFFVCDCVHVRYVLFF